MKKKIGVSALVAALVAVVVCCVVFLPRFGAGSATGDEADLIASTDAAPSAVSSAEPSVPSDGQDAATPAVSASQQAVLDMVASGEEGVDFEAGTMLLTFDPGTDDATVASTMEGLGYADYEAVTGDTTACARVVSVKLPQGVSVADAMNEAVAKSPEATVQPNFLYELLDEGQGEELLTSDEGQGGESPISDEGQDALDGDSSTSSVVVEASETIEPQASVNDPQASSQYQLNSENGVNAYAAWDVSKSDHKVAVAVIDSGCRLTHEDLAANIVASYDTATADHVMTGDINSQGHGTHVAGIISGVSNNGKGVSGVSYNADLVVIRVFYVNEKKEVVSNTEELLKAYEWLLDDSSGTSPADRYNVRVINMSVGDPNGGDDPAFDSAIDAAYDEGLLTVCASGNYSSNPLIYPASYETTVAVMALNSKNERYAKSNWGVGQELAAPGYSVLSTTFDSDSSYGTKNGTSMACPVVSGVAALCFAAQPGASAQAVRDALDSTATDLGAAGYDTTFGYGKVNARAAIDALIGTPGTRASLEVNSTMNSTCSTFVPGDTVTLSIGNAAGISADTRYTFTWTNDATGESGTLLYNDASSSCAFTPTSEGSYIFNVDIAEPGGITTFHSSTITVAQSFTATGISFSPEAPRKYGTAITITPQVSGYTGNLKYKYVYEKNNWNPWGALKQSSPSRSYVWRPSSAGDYNIYVNVIDPFGNVSTVSAPYRVMQTAFTFDELQVDASGTVGAPVSLSALTSGDTTGVNYKFVWEKDAWSSWGVVAGTPSAANTVSWTPERTGEYTIYCNVIDASGQVQTKTAVVEVSDSFDVSDIEFSDDVATVGEPFTFAPIVSGSTTGLSYKFVWEKDAWASWGIAQGPSSLDTCTWTPTVAGNYTFFINVIDAYGNVKTVSRPVTVVPQYTLTRIACSSATVRAGSPVTLSAVCAGDTSGLSYKFVWERNGWNPWGVARDLGPSNTCTWVPDAPGSYTLYLNVVDSCGNVQTLTRTYRVY